MQTNSSWQIEQRLPQVSRDLFNGRLESVLHYNESYPSFSESLPHSKVHNYSILELPQRGWELARFMKTENFLRSSAHTLENSEGANLCFRNPRAQFKLKKKQKQNPCQLAAQYSCLASSNDPLAALLSLCGMEEILPSSPCARYHAGECDSHSPVSDEYSGCKIKGETHRVMHTHTHIHLASHLIPELFP